MKTKKKKHSQEKKKFTQSEPKMNYILKLSDKDFKVIITLLNKVKQNPKQKKKRKNQLKDMFSVDKSLKGEMKIQLKKKKEPN